MLSLRNLAIFAAGLLVGLLAPRPDQGPCHDCSAVVRAPTTTPTRRPDFAGAQAALLRLGRHVEAFALQIVRILGVTPELIPQVAADLGVAPHMLERRHLTDAHMLGAWYQGIRSVLGITDGPDELPPEVAAAFEGSPASKNAGVPPTAAGLAQKFGPLLASKSGLSEDDCRRLLNGVVARLQRPPADAGGDPSRAPA